MRRVRASTRACGKNSRASPPPPAQEECNHATLPLVRPSDFGPPDGLDGGGSADRLLVLAWGGGGGSATLHVETPGRLTHRGDGGGGGGAAARMGLVVGNPSSLLLAPPPPEVGWAEAGG